MKNIFYKLGKFFIRLSDRYFYTYQLNGIISGEAIAKNNKNFAKIIQVIKKDKESDVEIITKKM